MSSVQRLVWLKKHSHQSAIEFEGLNNKNLFLKINPNNMIKFHIKVKFQLVFNNGLMPFF